MCPYDLEGFGCRYVLRATLLAWLLLPGTILMLSLLILVVLQDGVRIGSSSAQESELLLEKQFCSCLERH